jgi:hypothetical protein
VLRGQPDHPIRESPITPISGSVGQRIKSLIPLLEEGDANDADCVKNMGRGFS